MNAVTEHAEYPYCPYVGHPAEENAGRLVAFFTAVLVAVAALTPAHWLAAVAFLDYLWRGLVTTAPSPLTRLSTSILHRLRITPQWTEVAPRLFAERAETALAAAICGFFAVGQMLHASLTATVLVIAASLHAFAGVSVGGGLYEAWRSAKDRAAD